MVWNVEGLLQGRYFWTDILPLMFDLGNGGAMKGAGIGTEMAMNTLHMHLYGDHV